MSDTTTIQTSVEVREALHKRKCADESLDDVIRKLINQTPAPMGAIKEPEQPLEVVENEKLDDVPGGATCSHYDVVTGETCGCPAEWLQTVQYGESEPSELYLCDEHGPNDD